MNKKSDTQTELVEELVAELYTTMGYGEITLDEISVWDILDSLACAGIELKRNVLDNPASEAYIKSCMKEKENAK